ncbi:hypothetical protein DMH17_15175 [Raoultella planticola]|nr:hypothetical protein [Raoultella planticola]
MQSIKLIAIDGYAGVNAGFGLFAILTAAFIRRTGNFNERKGCVVVCSSAMCLQNPQEEIFTCSELSSRHGRRWAQYPEWHRCRVRAGC